MRMTMTLKLALFYCDDISTGSSSEQIVKTKQNTPLLLTTRSGQMDGADGQDRQMGGQTDEQLWKLWHIVNGGAR